MKNRIIDNFKNKNIAILGFGREGKSSYKYIRKYLKNESVTIVDKNKDIINDNLFKDDQNIFFKLGDDYLDNLENFDVIVKTAGISLNFIDAEKIIPKIVSQYSLVLEHSDAKVIGITGTKGKSTTSSLIYSILSNCGVKSILLGNIGLPVLDYIDDISDDTTLVLELSAFQLEYVKKAPHVSLLLNLYQEHLDYYGDVNLYYNSKLNILKKQTVGDYGFYFDEISSYINFSTGASMFNVGKDIYIKDDYVWFNDKKVYCINDHRNLQGDHNLIDIMFALGVASIYQLDMDKVSKIINEFKGLEHRMEFVDTINGVSYYDDAIATIPEATINCINTLKNVDTLIFGGMNRGIDYNHFVDFLNDSKITNFICMPVTGNLIGEKINTDKHKVYFVDNMEKAVEIAKSVTKSDASCVLSPAAPSYNVYKNFEEKGRHFKELVKR